MKYLFLFVLLLPAYTVVALKPDTVYVATPSDYNIPHENVSIKTPDGAELNTWVYTPDSASDKDITIILAYTDMGNMSYYISQAYHLQSKGYRVITFDYRGFGESSAFKINQDYLFYSEFVTDLEAVIDYADLKYSADAVGLFGLSMGTYISFSAAVTKEIDFLIMDSGLIDPSVFTERLKKLKEVNIILPNAPSGHIEKISALDMPMFFFNGTEDTITPVEDVKPLISNHEKSCLMIYNGKHLGAITTMGMQYLDYIDAFISTLNL